MAPRSARLLCLTAVGALLVAALSMSRSPSARADGDPASDVLLGENVFYRYSPAVPRALQMALNAVAAKAKAQGFPVKVALIAAPTDLGVIPDLFAKPESYARFLDQEISFTSRQRLLVVMAAGYGLQGFGGPALQAARGLVLPAGTTSTALARAALIAVPRLAEQPGTIGDRSRRSGAARGRGAAHPAPPNCHARIVLTAGCKWLVARVTPSGDGRPAARAARRPRTARARRVDDRAPR